MRNATTTGIPFTDGMASATQVLHLNHDIETIPYIILTSPQPVNPSCKRMECQIKACLMLGIIPDHQDLRIAAGCINLCRSCTYTTRRSNKQALQVCHGSPGMRIKSGIYILRVGFRAVENLDGARPLRQQFSLFTESQ